MNYEFHVGDYVKTWAGVVGRISKFEMWRHPAFIEDSVWLVYTTEKGNSFYFESEVSQLKYEFQCIGAYNFTKKEKKKIEPLNIQGYLSIQTVASVVNKLVDAVNLLLDKSTES